MKKILKYLITIVIIAVIVLGVVLLVDINRSNDYLYVNISSINFSQKTTYVSDDGKTLYEQLEAKLAEGTHEQFNVILQSNNNVAYNNLKSINIVNNKLFDYYYNLSALSIKATKNLQDNILNRINNVIKCYDNMMSEYNVLLRYLNNPDASYQYLQHYYNNFVISLANYQNEYSLLCNNFADYILSEVYNGSNNTLQFVGNQVIAIMNSHASSKLLESTKDNAEITSGFVTECLKVNQKFDVFNSSINESLTEYGIKFLNSYQHCPQIQIFLADENKIDFINNSEQDVKSDYLYVYNYLFQYDAGVI